jgi:hypothetical protein
MALPQLLVGFRSGALAFAMEKKAKWSMPRWLVLQRFDYRQLMNHAVGRSVWTAIRDSSVAGASRNVRRR